MPLPRPTPRLHACAPRGEAAFSACGTYRYRLARHWAPGPRLVAVLLNPSTACAETDDATLRACVARARGWGFSGLVIVNLFALRATDPRALRHAADPVGPGNDAALCRACAEAAAVLCGWGRHGVLQGRAEAVTALLHDTGRPLWHLGRTASGQPRHPLYLSRSTPPLPFP